MEKIRKDFNCEVVIHGQVDNNYLNKLFYRSPIYNELGLPIVPANFVTNTIGTGFVHCSYAHGFEDYKVFFCFFLFNNKFLVGYIS